MKIYRTCCTFKTSKNILFSIFFPLARIFSNKIFIKFLEEGNLEIEKKYKKSDRGYENFTEHVVPMKTEFFFSPIFFFQLNFGYMFKRAPIETI